MFDDEDDVALLLLVTLPTDCDNVALLLAVVDVDNDVDDNDDEDDTGSVDVAPVALLLNAKLVNIYKCNFETKHYIEYYE